MAEVHVLVVPSLGEGHINGILRFAQAMAAHKGLLITFGYPRRFYSLAHKRNKLAEVLHCASIRVEVVPDGLPTEEDKVPSEEQMMSAIPCFQDGVQILMEKLMAFNEEGSGLPPISCIISDTFVPWTQDLADKSGLPRVEFWTSTATVYSMGAHLSELVSRGHLPLKNPIEHSWDVDEPLIDFIPGLPPFPVTDLPLEFNTPDLSHPKFQFMLEAFSRVRHAHTILVHSLYELESNVFDALLQTEGFPIYSVGPLFHTDPSQAPPNEPASRSECLQWLDEQKPSSVVYVALGTIAMLTLHEVHAMALGLEASGYPFLWVVRPDHLSNGSLSESLPDGFMERIVAQGKGFIVPWAPQTEVLKHTSVRAFFSHCGWNSTLESLWEGLPMVTCPRVSEQRSNARSIVEKWKIGVELERQKDGSFTKEAVQKAIQDIMVNQEAAQRAVELRDVARRTIVDGGISHTNLVNFVERLRHLSTTH